MARQEQQVDPGGRAIQAGRDVVIHSGMSPDDMAEIMVAMAKQLSIYQADAMRTVEERLKEFQSEVVKRFIEPDQANSEAFRDPDFQYLIAEAQEAYARSGDAAVRGTLIDIIARRSLEKERNRMSITLNEAATKAALLTANEFAAMSLAYLVKYTLNNKVISFESLCEYLSSQLMPFVPDIAKEDTSFWHIEAQSCGSIEMGEVGLYTVLRTQYGGVLGRGFDRETLEAHLPDGQKNALDSVIIPCLHDRSKLQPNAMRREVLVEVAARSGLDKAASENVWNAFENTIPPQAEIVALLTTKVPNVQALFDVWTHTDLKHLKLNSVGIAIGHANAVRAVGFDAPLDVWIK